jgi:ribosomal protein S18 acetylase RimI-like enzyme
MQMTEISPITVRPARRGDVAAIIAMLADDHLGRARERLEEPLPRSYFDAFDAIERAANLQLVVAEEAGRVVGCLQLCLLPGLSSQGATRALVEDVRVASDRRGRGIGEQLLQWAIAEARAKQAALIELLTHESRVDAQRFYERLGFSRSHVGMVIRF